MQKIHIFLFQALIISSLFFVIACGEYSDESINQPPTCSITHPQNNVQFDVGEDILVAVVAEDSDGTISEVQLYVDNVEHTLKTVFPYNFTINTEGLTPGTHTVRAVAKDNQGVYGEATVSIVINQPSTESPNFVSFSNGKIPYTWQTTAWTIDNTVGYDDIYSLKATVNGAIVVTAKTLDVFSYVEFFTTGNNFNFYIDGIRSNPINSSGTGNWQQWIYALSPEAHTFKWETTSSNKLNLDAIKFAPSDLPKIRTVDVTQQAGNFATVNYLLLSNGNNAITALGICWSTRPNPTIADNKMTNLVNSTNNYASNIENLVHNTTYYVRAYASSRIGTAYGEELSFKTKIFIGDRYQGGIVAYIDATGEHGIIAAPEDQGTEAVWFNGIYDIPAGATGTAIGTGKSNTKAIVKAQGEGIYAAKLCDDLVLNGYDDWYLPSLDELNILWQNRKLIAGLYYTNFPYPYWSSSEAANYYYPYYAWYIDFGPGYPNFAQKDEKARVRAIRNF